MPAAIRQAARRGLPMHCPALAAEPSPRIACRSCGWSSVRLLQEPIGQHHPCASSSGRRRPKSVFLPVLVGSRLAVLETPKLVLGTPGKLKVQAVFLKEVLPAASARQDREEGIVMPP